MSRHRRNVIETSGLYDYPSNIYKYYIVSICYKLQDISSINHIDIQIRYFILFLRATGILCFTYWLTTPTGLKSGLMHHCLCSMSLEHNRFSESTLIVQAGVWTMNLSHVVRTCFPFGHAGVHGNRCPPATWYPPVILIQQHFKMIAPEKLRFSWEMLLNVLHFMWKLQLWICTQKKAATIWLPTQLICDVTTHWLWCVMSAQIVPCNFFVSRDQKLEL